MRVNLFVVSKSEAVCACAGRLKESAIPRDMLVKLSDCGLRAEVRALRMLNDDCVEVAKGILALSKPPDDAIALLVGDVAGLQEMISPHVLLHWASISIEPNPKNQLGSAYTQLIKKYMFVKSKIQDFSNKKLMLLPCRNCYSRELDEFLSLSAFRGNYGEFAGKVERLLGILRGRTKPKTKTSRPESYFVDDRDNHFKLGFERHASASDSCPPHSTRCVLGINFRMGIRLDRLNHFNVSTIDRQISGQFVGCHGDQISVQPKTHLNMFPNGQFE